MEGQAKTVLRSGCRAALPMSSTLICFSADVDERRPGRLFSAPGSVLQQDEKVDLCASRLIHQGRALWVEAQ